jgi:hypothetical protein
MPPATCRKHTTDKRRFIGSGHFRVALQQLAPPDHPLAERHRRHAVPHPRLPHHTTQQAPFSISAEPAKASHNSSAGVGVTSCATSSAAVTPLSHPRRACRPRHRSNASLAPWIFCRSLALRCMPRSSLCPVALRSQCRPRCCRSSLARRSRPARRQASHVP